MKLKQFIRDLIYTFTRRVTYKDAVEIKKLADNYMSGCEYMDYSDIIERFPNSGVTTTYIPNEIEDRIDNLLLEKATKFLSEQTNNIKCIKKKHRNFLLKNARMFYFNRTDWDFDEFDEDEEEFINYIVLEYSRVRTKDLIGMRY